MFFLFNCCLHRVSFDKNKLNVNKIIVIFNIIPLLKKGKYNFFKFQIRNITYHLFVEYFHSICWEIDSDTKVVQKKCYFFLICSLDRFQDCELKCSHPPTMKNLKLIILIFLNLTKKIYILNAIFGSSKLILIKI